MREQVEALLCGYATGNLTAEQRRWLLEEALHDQEIFDALVREDALRELVEDPSCVEALRASVGSERAPTARWYRTRAPWMLLGIGAAASLMVVATLDWHQGPTRSIEIEVPLATGPRSSRGIAAPPPTDEGQRFGPLFELRPRNPSTAALGLDRKSARPVYSPGEPMRVGFLVETGSSVLLLERGPDGRIQLLFPDSGGSALVQAGKRMLVPPEVNRSVSGPPGQWEIRLLVFPPGTDPLAAARGESLPEPQTLLVQTYDVVTGR